MNSDYRSGENTSSAPMTDRKRLIDLRVYQNTQRSMSPPNIVAYQRVSELPSSETHRSPLWRSTDLDATSGSLVYRPPIG